MKSQIYFFASKSSSYKELFSSKSSLPAADRAERIFFAEVNLLLMRIEKIDNKEFGGKETF